MMSKSNASGRRYLRNPVHTQRSVVCAGYKEDEYVVESLDDARY
ncbi:MAG: hypothetical protein U0K66_01135 [Paludibacteraceae bacterium]|nr:hypothetical protein [Paludibacteraceae bacterium]